MDKGSTRCYPSEISAVDDRAETKAEDLQNQVVRKDCQESWHRGLRSL